MLTINGISQDFNWDKIVNTPTTIAGYGIEDGMSKMTSAVTNSIILANGTAGDTVKYSSATLTTTALTIPGNLVLGNTANNFSTLWKSINIGSHVAISEYNNSDAVLTYNVYHNTNWKYSTDGPASFYYQTGGAHYFKRFASGTAGATATEVDVLSLDSNGYASFSSRFACNGQTAQGSMSLGAAATDLSSTITLVNNIRTALINNGIGIT